MDVNIATDVKGYGAPAVTNTELADAEKPIVTPVVEASEGVSVKLDNEALHGQKEQADGAQGKLSQEDLEEVIAEVQTRMDAIGSKLRFGLSEHEDIADLVVRVTDKNSGELIKQFPSEDIIQLQVKLNDLVGILFDKEV